MDWHWMCRLAASRGGFPCDGLICGRFPPFLFRLFVTIGCTPIKARLRSSPYPEAQLGGRVQPATEQLSRLEVVHEFTDQYPVGVAVTPEGRIFVCYPRWQDPVRFTLGEIRDGQEVPYPSQELNNPDSPENFFSVQNVRAMAGAGYGCWTPAILT